MFSDNINVIIHKFFYRMRNKLCQVTSSLSCGRRNAMPPLGCFLIWLNYICMRYISITSVWGTFCIDFPTYSRIFPYLFAVNVLPFCKRSHPAILSSKRPSVIYGSFSGWWALAMHSPTGWGDQVENFEHTPNIPTDSTVASATTHNLPTDSTVASARAHNKKYTHWFHCS